MAGSLGGYNAEIARFIYKSTRQLVDSLVKAGKIAAKNADKEWAKRVSKELLKAGAEVPKWISKILK